jgi:hypothetical protein
MENKNILLQFIDEHSVPVGVLTLVVIIMTIGFTLGRFAIYLKYRK